MLRDDDGGALAGRHIGYHETFSIYFHWLAWDGGVARVVELAGLAACASRRGKAILGDRDDFELGCALGTAPSSGALTVPSA